MADNIVQVKLEALYQEFKTAMGTAAASVSEAAAKMVDSLGVLATSSRESTAAVSTSFVEMGAVSESVTTGMIASLEMLIETLLPMAIVFGAAFEFSDSISSTVDLTVSAEKLGRVLGMTTEQASIMNVALKSVHSTTEEYTAAAKGLDRQIKSNEDAVKAMGVVTRDASGELRNQNDILLDSLQLLQGYKEGTDRNLAAQQIFGRGIQVSSEMLALNRDKIAAAAEEAAKFGLIIGGEGVTSTENYRAATLTLNEALEGLKVKFASAVMPVLTSFAEFLSTNASTAITIAKIALDALIASMIWFAATSIIPTLVAMTAAVYSFITAEGIATTATIALTTAFELLTGPIGIIIALTGAIWALSNAHTQAETTAAAFATALGTIDTVSATNHTAAMGALEDLAAITQEHLDAAEAALVQAQAEQTVWSGGKGGRAGGEMFSGASARVQSLVDLVHELRSELDSIGEKGRALNANPGGAGGASYVNPKDAAAEEAARQKALAEQKAAAAAARKIEIDAYNARMELLKGDEASAKGHWDKIFDIEWEEIKAATRVYGEGSREQEAAINHLLASTRAAAAEAVKIAQLQRDQKNQIVLSGIDAEEEAANFEVQMGRETKSQLIAQQIEFEDKRYQLKHAALQLAADEETEDAVRHQQLLNQLTQMEADHLLAVMKFKEKAIAESQVNEQALAHSLTESAADTTAKLLTGQISLRNAEKSLLRSALTSFTDYLKQKLLASTLFAKLEIAIQNMINAVLAALHIKSAAQAIGAKTSETMVVGGQNAVVAGTGAFAALAAIPIVGPVLAAIAGPAMFALVMAMVSRGASHSAAGGFDIPAGVNPLTQLHQREMVLPAAQADVVRNLADTGGPSNTGDNYHIYANDAASFQEFLRRHPSELSRGIERARRLGHIKVRT